MNWTPTWYWRNQFAYADAHLARRCSEDIVSARHNFCGKVICGLQRLRTEILFPVENTMSVYCALGEVHSLCALRDIPEERLSACRGASCIDMAAWICDLSQLRVEFRFLRKNAPYWNLFPKNKRRFRSTHDWAINYQCLSTFGLGAEFFRRALTRLTPF